MRTRCNNPNFPAYPSYGGRGISICPEWDDFWVFVSDMGECPEGFTLDRIDIDGDYTPDNCRWASRSNQQFNRRDYSKSTQYIRTTPDGFRVQITLLPGMQHTRHFVSFENAQDYKSDCMFEREVHRLLGKYD